MPVSRRSFGALHDGRAVEALTLAGAGGVRVTVLTLGAAIHAVLLPGRDGALANVALGYATAPEYLAGGVFLGATVGRYANRLAGGRFSLDGAVHRISRNDGANALHGGVHGFGHRLWSVAEVGGSHVRLALTSPDGDQGFPGTLHAACLYALVGDTLTVGYEAVTDAPTLCNLTSHAYWNLAGEGSAAGAMNHLLTIRADAYLPVDAALIPTGEVRDVTGTPFDFRVPTPVGARIRAADPQLRPGRGYDHNWVCAREPAAAPREVAALADPVSGRMLTLFSTKPGLQMYAGNGLDGTIAGTSGRAYRQGDAVVLEPQLFPDTPNRPAFGSAVLRPGETYRHVIAYRFGLWSG